MHLTPAGFPFGIPGIGLLIDGAMQQAPQSGRQFSIPAGLVAPDGAGMDGMETCINLMYLTFQATILSFHRIGLASVPAGRHDVSHNET